MIGPREVTLEDMGEGAADGVCLVCEQGFTVRQVVVGVETMVICDCGRPEHQAVGITYIHADCAKSAIASADWAGSAGMN